MKYKINFFYILLLLNIFFVACKKDKDNTTTKSYCNTEGALATCLTPKFDSAYYIEQGVKYFLTMQSDIPPSVQPNYSDLVIRYEWPPWLLLTGYGRDFLIQSDILLKLNPTKYDTINCQFFNEQPFCRCHVVFDYSGEKCPIYEEFVFNDQGEITFIEAWSDYESKLPQGMNAGADGVWSYDEYWGKQPNVYRLSTKIPGLGNSTGKIVLNSSYMQKAMAQDANIADLEKRLKDPFTTYIQYLATHQEELANGCEAPEGDIFPYYYPE
jgi:hypothetical protein